MPCETRSTLFDKLEAEDTKQLMTLPPTNAFEEMIRWTEEGKLWTFPIDNEQGTATLFTHDVISLMFQLCSNLNYFNE